MPSALVVIVLVAGTTAPDGTSRAIATALESSLDPGSSVIVGESESDVDLASALAKTHADAAAAVVWADALHARLRVVVPATRTTAERDVVFSEQDVPDVRGRTVGFLLATMVSPFVAPAATPPAAETKPAAAVVERERVFAIDASFAATAGIGGDATAVGGEIGTRYRFGRWLEARGGAMLGAGVVAAAGASSTSLRFKLGAGAIIHEASDHSATFALRLDFVATRHALATPEGAESRWVPCVSPSLEVALRVFGPWSVLASGGAEVAAGRTRVFVGDEERASIPVLRIIGNAGVKADF